MGLVGSLQNKNKQSKMEKTAKGTQKMMCSAQTYMSAKQNVPVRSFIEKPVNNFWLKYQYVYSI